ncbi:peptidoglycan-binding domain-containing protein [Microbacterium karelineae]|uniref:peptidoglycan-binding domain-containing protein n=1 Tax=Microbacterium karelineae TaxID=2654283 RepID=UPI0012E9EFB2|nr:peptidoglycan-binding domain-containing protein [Microbacterium karelineae]
MPTWAPITDQIVDTPWGRSRGDAPVVGLMAHHQANGDGPDSVAYMVGPNERDSHPTYATDKTGRVVGIVPPDLCPSSTGYDLDRGAVTIELANIGGAPDWPVADASTETLAQLIAHHAAESERAGHPVEVNEPGRTQAGFWVGWDSQYRATECPGNDVRALIPAAVARANEILAGGPSAIPADPAAPPFPLPSGWYFGPENGPAESVSCKHANAAGTVDELRKMLWRWQQRMEDRGWQFPLYGSDGIYGDETREVALTFQREKGLVADGLVGSVTWAAAWTEPVT